MDAIGVDMRHVGSSANSKLQIALTAGLAQSRVERS